MSSKFPSLRRIRHIRIDESMEGVELRRCENREIRCDGSPEENSKQLLEAMVYYGNLAELPYTTSHSPDAEEWTKYDSTEHLLFEFFSKSRLLKPGKRQQRQEIYAQVKGYIEADNISEIRNILLAKKVENAASEFDAEDIELGENDE